MSEHLDWSPEDEAFERRVAIAHTHARPVPTGRFRRRMAAAPWSSRRSDPQTLRRPQVAWLTLLALLMVVTVLGGLIWRLGAQPGDVPVIEDGTATVPPSPPRATPAATISAEATATLEPPAIMDRMLTRFADQSLFSGAVLVARAGEVLLEKGYGMADRARGLPNLPQTKFRVASITGQFTAVAILMLQEQGKLDVQAPVCDYVPNCPAHWQPVTLHHLLTHTAGLPAWDDPDNALYQPGMEAAPIAVADLVGLFRELPLKHEPGTTFTDSSEAYILLGYVIEQVSGQPYADFVGQHIFDPLGMADSGYDENPEGLALDYTSGSILADQTHPSWGYASFGAYSTVADLYRWSQAMEGEALLPQAALDLMFTGYVINTDVVPDRAPEVGYGWNVGTIDEHRAVWGMSNSNASEGYTSDLKRYFDDDVTLIVLSNSGQGSDQGPYGAGHVGLFLHYVLFGP